MNESIKILELKLSLITFDKAIEVVKKLALDKKPSYVCFANVHMMIEAHKHFTFAEQVNEATLILADGMPLATACNLLMNRKQERIAGMDFMPRLIQSINYEKDFHYKIFLYGSSLEVLDSLESGIRKNYQNVNLVG